MKTRDEVLVGLVVTAAIVVTIVGSLWLARGGLSKGYPLYAKFPWGAGLKQGADAVEAGPAVVQAWRHRSDRTVESGNRRADDQG